MLQPKLHLFLECGHRWRAHQLMKSTLHRWASVAIDFPLPQVVLKVCSHHHCQWVIWWTTRESFRCLLDILPLTISMSLSNVMQTLCIPQIWSLHHCRNLMIISTRHSVISRRRTQQSLSTQSKHFHQLFERAFSLR